MVTRPLLSIFLFTVLGTFSSVVWGKQEFSNWQQASQQQAWNQQASQQQTAWNGGAPLQRQTQNQYYPGQSQYGQEESFQGKDIQNLQGQYNQNRETQIELTSGQLHPQQQGIFRQGVLPRSQQRNQQHGLPGEYTDFNQAIDGHSNFSVQNSMPPQSPEQWLDQENSGSIVGNGPGEDANGFLLPEEEIFDDGFWDSTYFPFEDWENSFEFGLNGTNGNSDTLNIRMGIDTLYEDEAYKRSLKFKYSNKSNNNQTIAHHINLEGRLEKKLSDRWTYFVHGTTEYDEFKAFDTRVAVDTGFGWDFLKNDINTLTFRAGLGASYEIGGPNDEVKPELVTGISWERKIYDNQKLSFGVEVFPNLEDFADHRVNTTAAWEIDVAPEWGTKLKLSIDDRYDSTPGTAKHNDLDYGFLLLWDF